MNKDEKIVVGVSLFWLVLWALAIALTTSCHFIHPTIDPDWIDTPEPTDTIPDPIVNDTCEAFEPINEPLFITFFINLDLPLIADSTYYYQASDSAPLIPIDPNTFFDTVYYSGINIAGIKNGTDNASQYNDVARIWIRSGSGLKHVLSFASMSFHFRGALTYEQFMNEWETHKSLQTLRFHNTGYSCEQIISFLEILIEECYETPNKVDLRPVSIGSCQIPQSIIDEYILRGSTVMQ